MEKQIVTIVTSETPSRSVFTAVYVGDNSKCELVFGAAELAEYLGKIGNIERVIHETIRPTDSVGGFCSALREAKERTVF